MIIISDDDVIAFYCLLVLEELVESTLSVESRARVSVEVLGDSKVDNHLFSFPFFSITKKSSFIFFFQYMLYFFLKKKKIIFQIFT